MEVSLAANIVSKTPGCGSRENVLFFSGKKVFFLVSELILCRVLQYIFWFCIIAYKKNLGHILSGLDQ